MRKHKIFMVGNDPGYTRWIPFDFDITKRESEATIAFWIGGMDVSGWIYGEKEGQFTYSNNEISKYELDMWNYFKDKNVFKIGCCKGSQNLGCFNGSKMIQHSQHPHYHKVKTKDGLTLDCISTHHQQILLDEKITGLKEGIDYELISWAERLSPFHLNGEDKDYNFPPDYKEPEITWFGKTNSFLIQSHPELMDFRSPFVKYCQDVLSEKIKIFS